MPELLEPLRDPLAPLLEPPAPLRDPVLVLREPASLLRELPSLLPEPASLLREPPSLLPEPASLLRELPAARPLRAGAAEDCGLLERGCSALLDDFASAFLLELFSCSFAADLSMVPADAPLAPSARVSIAAARTLRSLTVMTLTSPSSRGR